MKNVKRILAVALGVALCVSALAGCKPKTPTPDDNNTVVQNTTPIVVGYSNFSSKFSPFFAETAYDQDAMAMTQVSLLTSDRKGAIVLKGIEGETIPYNGKDYTYKGIADCKITENTDGTVYYDFTLRTDVKFSDGEPLTVDDVIFSMYVLADPTYDGSSTLFAVPIKGMNEYRSDMTTLSNYIAGLGENTTDFSKVDEATVKAFWAAVNDGGAKFAQSIVDYCVQAGANKEGDSVAACAANWGYDLKEDATAKDFFLAIAENYGWNFSAMEAETAGTALSELIPAEVYESSIKGIKVADKSVDKIEGIEKTGDNTLRVTLTQIDATAIYQLGVTVAPMHYYGNKADYDYANNKFGFTKGDLSPVRAKTTQPMGAGPFKFVKFENGVINFESNDSYFLGTPRSKYIQFKETNDKDKINGIKTGSIDITDPAFDDNAVKAIEEINGGKLSGDKITVNTVDNLGYGYVGISANRVNVGGKAGSDESKNLRKALATVLAVYRDVSVKSYYGERASVINYPISNTSWAAPQSTDEGYKVAFSTGADGQPIYTSDMDTDAKYAAAKKAALAYFEKAGFTVADGKVTAAPAGARLSYELQIPADGDGNHPSFMMVTEASKALAEIGITLNIKDLANSADLWTAIESEQCDMWAAAWGATPDPDMYQIYYSDAVNGGKNAGGSNYMYDIVDEKLDELIMKARKSLDKSYRKTVYKECLEMIVDWAVEIPVYQRQNAIIFSNERVNMASVTPDITTFYGWLSEVQNIEAAAKG